MATAKQEQDVGRPPQGWRRRMYEVIFESDTPAGRAFDKWIITAILVSVVVVMADSVEPWHSHWRVSFDVAEWFFTALFTLEYMARLVSVQRPLRYALSFFGMVDLLAILPTYLALFLPELHALIDVRVLRLLRVFRIFRLTNYMVEYQILGEAREGPQNGFTNIPTSVYWAITTITTVGFGDITPKTDIGRLIASVMMLIGWGTLAVPTGIVTAEMTARRQAARASGVLRTCSNCGAGGYGPEARYCQMCGTALPAIEDKA